jgi:hypothetical protein
MDIRIINLPDHCVKGYFGTFALGGRTTCD